METRHDMLSHGVYIVTASHGGKRAGLALSWGCQLAKDKVFEFAFIGASLKLRGASGAPMRPIALPVR